MSSSTLESELSSAELRSKLFHNFKTKGVVQSVKTQLRKQLALELHEKALSSNIQRKETKYDGSLFQRICNSLFTDHLKRCSYDYTLSVFITESHTNLQDVIPLQDILELLHCNPKSKLHKMLVKTCVDSNNVKGFLWSLVVAIAQEHGQPTTERSMQTDPWDPTPSLDKKMFEIERLQLEKVQSTIKNDYESIEAKVLAFQRRYEEQKQVELKNEMERFRSTELANMRLEEREKCQKEFQQMKFEYEKRYDGRLKDLERGELEINSKALRQEKETEKEGYEQRQKILEEMESVTQRDLELKRNHKSAMTAVEIEEQKLKAKEEQLMQKEKAIQEMEEQYENKLKHEILRIKLQSQEKDFEQSAAMEMREQQLREEKMNFLSQKEVYMKWKEEADRLREENGRLNASVATAKHAYDVLSQKYEKVSEQYQQVNDYGAVKNENMVLHKELEIFKKCFEDFSVEKSQQKKEHQKLVRELLNKINQNSPEMENEMRTLQEREQSITLKYQVLQNQHELLQKSHILQLRKNEELRKLYENIMLSQRELLRECDELKLELHFANQEKEGTSVVKTAKSKLPSPPSLKVTNGARTSTLLSNKKYTLPTNITREELSPAMDIKASNEVLEKLEQEALELEKSYKKFQERQMQIPVYVGNNMVTPTLMQSTCATRSNNDAMGDTTPQTNVLLRSDSFDLSHLIPSRGKTESNEGRNVTRYSTSTPLNNESCALTVNALSSSTHVVDQKQSVSLSLATSQIDSALSRLRLTKSCNPPSREITETRGPFGNIYSQSMYDSVSTRSKYDTLISKTPKPTEVPATTANLQMDSLTQLPLTETIQGTDSTAIQQSLMETVKPMDSLTQAPLIETISPMNSLTQVSLTNNMAQPNRTLNQSDSVQTPRALNSLTQLPYVDTMQAVDSLTQIPMQTVDSLTQLPMQTVESLTQLPLLETPHHVNVTEASLTEITRPFNSLTQLPLTETIVSNASLAQFSLEDTHFVTVTREQIIPTQSDRLADGKTSNLGKAVTSVTFATPGLEVTGPNVETSDNHIANNFDTQGDEFDSKNDIFKTSNFMMKGFQSTRIASDMLLKPEKPIGNIPVETDEKAVLRHSTPDISKNSEVENIQNLSGKPQHSSIGRDVSTDTSNIMSGPFDSEENERDQEKAEGELKTVSEGEVDVGHSKPDGNGKADRNGKSEGEVSQAIVAGGNGNSEGELVAPDNPMEQYMKMILARREADQSTGEAGEVGEAGDQHTDIQHSIHEDVPLSEVEEKNENSEPSSSEFEW